MKKQKGPLAWALIAFAALFLLVMLVLPLVLVASEALAKGWAAYTRAITEPFAVKALFLTLEATVLAVVCNTVFGLASAFLLTKFAFRGKAFLGSLIDLPFAISPVVAGLFFIMLFGRMSPLYPFLRAEHIAIVFAVPGIILATIFVTFPFITREWALVYGVILCTARAMGEFGAVSVVSGHVRGKTNTLPLHIEILYNEYNFTAAFAVASILVLLAVVLLVLRNLVEWRTKRTERGLSHAN